MFHVILVVADAAVGDCTTDADCSLGGICDPINGSCICDPTWTGPTCSQLNLTPASTAPLLLNGADQTWGGKPVYDAADKMWHLFYSELLNNCSLNYWTSNSVVSHAVSSMPQGPYKKKDRVYNAFRHNPTIAYDSFTKTFVLMTIGDGDAPIANIRNCSTSGTRSQEVLPPQKRLGDSAQAMHIHLAYASTANGPWTELNESLLIRDKGWEDGSFTNPSLYFFENGTTILAYRGGDKGHLVFPNTTGWPHYIGIAVADTWRGPYVPTSTMPVFSEINEDPYIFRDARGNFHMLTHSFSRDPCFDHTSWCVGGHAFSRDGISWTWAGGAYGRSINYTDGSSAMFLRRERPQVIMVDNAPAYLTNGVLSSTDGRSTITLQPIARK